MSSPLFLPYGIVSIYGIGYTPGLAGTIPETGASFGIIDQVSQYDIYWAEVGFEVCFKEVDVNCRLAYENSPHTLVPEAKLVCREFFAP